MSLADTGGRVTVTDSSRAGGGRPTGGGWRGGKGRRRGEGGAERGVRKVTGSVTGHRSQVS